MARIRFTNRELNLLKLCLNTNFDNEVVLSSEMQQKLIDSVSNFFLKHGLKKNGEPNQLGIELEDLIDKLNNY